MPTYSLVQVQDPVSVYAVQGEAEEELKTMEFESLFIYRPA